MTLATAAFALAGAAFLVCWALWREVRVLRRSALASHIVQEEYAAQRHMDLELARDFDDALERISEESRAALLTALESLRSQQPEMAWTEALPDAVVVQQEGSIVFSNLPAEELFGTTSETLLGSNLEHWFLNARDVDQLCPGERLVQRADGDTRIVAPADIPIEFEGAPARLVLMRDITSERRVEKQLRLADRMTSLGSLVAGIAHELNNPMSYVLANLEMLGDELAELELPKELSEELAEMLTEAREGCTRIATTVGELQRFSRPPPSGNGGSISQIIGSACAITGSTIRSKAELEISIAEDAVLRDGADQLTHVLVNLLLNAMESLISEPESDAPRHIALRAYRQANAAGDLVIEVEDTGPGIPEDLQERIFDPFYTTRNAAKASGLGLPICYSMVTALGGDLEVHSALGAGATMRVRLPADLGAPVDPS